MLSRNLAVAIGALTMTTNFYLIGVNGYDYYKQNIDSWREHKKRDTISIYGLPIRPGQFGNPDNLKEWNDFLDETFSDL